MFKRLWVWIPTPGTEWVFFNIICYKKCIISFIKTVDKKEAGYGRTSNTERKVEAKKTPSEDDKNSQRGTERKGTQEQEKEEETERDKSKETDERETKKEVEEVNKVARVDEPSKIEAVEVESNYGNGNVKVDRLHSGKRHFLGKLTRLESLAEETLEIGGRFESRRQVDEKIRKFLQEESIIERTADCELYFSEHVTPVAAELKVSLFHVCGDQQDLEQVPAELVDIE